MSKSTALLSSTAGDAPPVFSTGDLTLAFDDEPRIHDLLLADRLGFKSRYDVRQLIKRNAAELRTYGDLIAAAGEPIIRHGTEYSGECPSEPAASQADASVQPIIPCATVKSRTRSAPRPANAASVENAGAATKAAAIVNGAKPKPSAQKAPARRRGRPTKDYWLNEGQALTICALARTRPAARVRRELITVFMAHRRGEQMMLALPAPAGGGEAVRHG